jgi:hypothetical protein
MTPPRKAKSQAAPAATIRKNSRRWLLFVHQLPATPSTLRVQTWRRLQQFGAIPHKQSVYVLPDTPNTREDLAWLTTQVKAAGDDAEVFVGAPADSWSDDTLAETVWIRGRSTNGTGWVGSFRHVRCRVHSYADNFGAA